MNDSDPLDKIFGDPAVKHGIKIFTPNELSKLQFIEEDKKLYLTCILTGRKRLAKPEEVIRQLAPGRVKFTRNETPLGHIANFQTCLARSRGEIIHLLHGDDIVRFGF